MQTAIFGKFWGKIKIFSTHSLLHRKFLTVCWKIALPFRLFNLRWRCHVFNMESVLSVQCVHNELDLIVIVVMSWIILDNLSR